MASDEQEEIIRMRERIHDLTDVVNATVLRHATIDANLSHLLTDFKEHREDSRSFMRDTGVTLKEIQAQTTRTNGRVDGHDRDLIDLKRPRTGTHEQRRTTDTGNAVTINIPINTKTILAILSAIVALAMMGWKAGLFS